MALSLKNIRREPPAEMSEREQLTRELAEASIPDDGKLPELTAKVKAAEAALADARKELHIYEGERYGRAVVASRRRVELSALLRQSAPGEIQTAIDEIQASIDNIKLNSRTMTSGGKTFSNVGGVEQWVKAAQQAQAKLE